MGTIKSNCEEYCAFHELAGHRLIYVHLSGSMRPNFISPHRAIVWVDFNYTPFTS